jgi:hypothetical protein
MNNKAPLTEPIIIALSKLIDDAQLQEKREPTHYDLDIMIKRVGLVSEDPKMNGQSVGKSKRIRTVLSWAIENELNVGEQLVALVINSVRGHGGFRTESKNYCGEEAINNLISAFESEGYTLFSNGEIKPKILDNLSEKEMTKALLAYAQRARKGAEDAALVVGTGKDLLEAVSKHILVMNSISQSNSNFPFLLAQAFIALGMVTPQHAIQQNEPATARYERALYELGCAINGMRNKEGTGHGRPFCPNITQEEALSAVQSIGIIADYMLKKLKI